MIKTKQPSALLPFEQVLQNTEMELRLLEKQQAERTQQLQTLQREFETLTTREEVRTTRLNNAQATVEQCQDAYETAVVKNQVSQGTMGSIQDTNTLKKQWERAQADSSKLEERAEKEAEGDAQRRQKLHLAFNQYQSDLAAFQRQQHLLEQARDEVFQNWGESVLTSCLAELNELQAARQEKAAALAEADKALDQFSLSVLTRLGQWPDQQAALIHALPDPKDATTEVLLAMKHLVTLLLEQGKQVERFGSRTMEKAGMPFTTFDALLSIDSHALFPVFSSSGQQPSTLLQKQMNLENLLRVYIAQKKTQMGEPS